MDLVVCLLGSGALLAAAYAGMRPRLFRWLGLDAAAETPARRLRDGLDFEPLRVAALLPQHFSAIAAAGPIVGPVLAGVLFGWAPTLVWILVGSVLVGGVHDLVTLVASVRHGGRSIAEVVRRHMNRRAYLLFLAFIWVSLVYVVVAFADVTAGAFVQAGSAAGAEAPGPAVATSSILYLGLAVAMGLSLRRLGLSPVAAKAIFLPAVLGAILLGPVLPLDLGRLLPGLPAQKTWNGLLLCYCAVASLAPVWILLQPRGELGGWFLYFILGAGVLGILVGGAAGDLSIAAPAFTAAPLLGPAGSPPPLFPILFITVACGACSGFHSIVASGTTSKQLDRETDALPVAYGGMLLEGFFAVLSLSTVMILAKPAGAPDAIYAGGIARFLHHATFGALPVEVAYRFALLCFATFVFDTLDAATRLARYVLMELAGWTGRVGRSKMAAATLATLALPAAIVLLPPAVVDGKTLPIWKVFWGLFGSSNQLLAALALMAAAVWLRAEGRRAALPAAGSIFMLAMTLWSLGLTIAGYARALATGGGVAALRHVEAGVAFLLAALALWLVGEVLFLLRLLRRPATP